MSKATSPAAAPSAIESQTVRKVKTRIIPFVFFLFVIAILDRNNIGFASLTMNKELAISSQQYGFIAGIFFLGYFIFEVPSNLLLHRIGARIWIARILITWGIVTMLSGFVRTAHELYAVRFLLGFAEAGYFPGILLYLTYWFRQRDLAQTAALFLTANPVANIIGAPFSGMVLDHVHWWGLSSWRWLLILEGVPAILGGALTYFLLPSRPSEAKFLTAEEKSWITTELSREEQTKLAASRMTVAQTLLHRRVWHLTAVCFCFLLGLYSMIFWMPQFVKTLSGQQSNTAISLLVMIPYLVGLPVMILVARSSDRRMERRYHAAVPLVIAAAALVLLGTIQSGSVFLSLTLWCLVASGSFSVYGPFWSLPNEFLTGFSAAAGIALINCFGNLGGFVGPFAIGAIGRKTGSLQTGLVFVAFFLFTSAMLIVALRKRTVPDTEAAVLETEVRLVKVSEFPPHSVTVRVTHWITTISFLALLLSGVGILLAHPRLYWGETGGIGAPSLIDLPLPFADLPIRGPSRYLHFLSAWMLVVTGLVYVAIGVITGHVRKRLLPDKSQLRWNSIRQVVSDHVRFKRPSEDESITYNLLQRVTYLVVIFGLVPLMIWTGLAMSPGFTAVFPSVVLTLGGFQAARTIHFFVAVSLIVFLLVHVAMVCLAGFRQRVAAMITGRISSRTD